MDAAHRATDKEIERLQKKIRPIYAKAKKKIGAEIDGWIKTVKDRSDELLQRIESAKTESELQAAKNAYNQFFVRSVNNKDSRFSKMQHEVVKHLYDANKETARIINSKTVQIYTDNYNFVGRKIQRDLDGYEFKQISEEDAEQYGEITRQTVDQKKDRSWNEKNIASAVVAGALMLWGADKIAKHAAALTAKKNLDGANRQASDMLTDAESKGRLDSLYRAYDEGFDGIKKEWVCVFDNRTRDTHREYNDIGPVPLDFEYNAGLKRPRDKNCGDLADVCNCRCAITWDTGLAKSGTRAARIGEVTGSYKKPSSFENTQTETVKQMTYKEWMKWRSR
jgi:hypothetical protein